MGALAGLMFLAACAASGEVEQIAPPLEMPQGFSLTGEAEVPAEWWTVFGDEELNALMDEALAGNFDIKTAWDRLDQARAAARIAGASLLPDVSGTGGASRTRTKIKGVDAVYVNEFSLGLQASYELDLWGRVRASVRSAGLTMMATREDLDAAAMSLSAEVALTWFRIREALAEIEILDRQITTNADMLDVLNRRFLRGRIDAADVLRQEKLLEATKAGKIIVESQLKVLRHRMAILLGRHPKSALPEGASASGGLPDMPAMPAVGLPAELIRRRPDIRAAHLRLHAADSGVSAAIADRFPKITLSLGMSTSSDELRDLFDNWIATMAANLVAPILDGGRRSAEVDRQRALASEKLNLYGKAVLVSLGEVEDALAQEADQRRLVENLERQMDLSTKTVERVRDRYLKGAEDFLSVLDAQRTHQVLEIELARARQRLLEYRIDLYRALGGGWELERPAKPAKTENAK